jgi:hypothetical protein
VKRATDKAKRRHVSEAYSPDAKLVEGSALHFRWAKEALGEVLSLFGNLPMAGQTELISKLIAAHGRFQLRGRNVQTITDIQKRNQLRAVETSARRLLRLLGVNVNNIPPREHPALLADCSASRFVSLLRGPAATNLVADKRQLVADAVPIWLTILELGQMDRSKESDLALIRAKMKENTDLCNNAIVGLCWIYERAKMVAGLEEPKATAQRQGPLEPPKRGGARNPPTQKGQVIRDALAMYSEMRRQYPDSGNRPGLGAPMRSFVRSVGSLFGAELIDDEIDEVWRTTRHRGS